MGVWMVLTVGGCAGTADGKAGDSATPSDSTTGEPSGLVLFSDDLDTDTSANWTVRFGANNGIYDADVRWAFDYSTLSPPIPPAPRSPGTTLGVFLQVNRTNSAANGTAGINLYPGRTSAAISPCAPTCI